MRGDMWPPAHGRNQPDVNFRADVTPARTRRRRRPQTPAGRTVPGLDGRTETLQTFHNFLTSDDTRQVSATLLKTAYRNNMEFKKTRYEELRRNAMEDVEKQKTIAQEMQKELRQASNCNETDNWSIFEGVSRSFVDARRRCADIDSILAQIGSNLQGSISNGRPPSGGDTELWAMHSRLVAAVERMGDFGSQPHVVDAAVRIVDGFLKNPASIRTKFLNMMMVGSAGVGKTTLAKAVAQLFASCGMFVGNRVREAGRAEFIGEYEGQTVARTRAFLLSSLDCGVVFVDEAYAITPWDRGKPESYGSEAVSAIVEFTSQYKGLYCLMCAGYEKEMRRYFLPTNPGLARRFPFCFLLNDFSDDGLVAVFKKALGKELGGADADQLFAPDAFQMLQRFLSECATGENTTISGTDSATNETYADVPHFEPAYPLLYKTLVANQAGSMTNLAEEAANALLSAVSFTSIPVSRPREAMSVAIPYGGPKTWGFMLQNVIQQRLQNTAMSDWPWIEQELTRLNQVIGASGAS